MIRWPAWFMLLVGCGGGGNGAVDAVVRVPMTGTYATVDSTCGGNAPTMFELSRNADGSIAYAPCLQTTCTPDAAPMFDDGTGALVGSGAVQDCGTDPECGCEVDDVTFQGDKAAVEADGSVIVSVGRGGHRFTGCPGSPPPPAGFVLTWCDVHGVLQP